MKLTVQKIVPQTNIEKSTITIDIDLLLTACSGLYQAYFLYCQDDYEFKIARSEIEDV